MVLGKSLEEFLIADGLEVLRAIDGEIGAQMALTEKPDLILLDIVLPKKDGYQVLSEVKKNNETKDIPIILLTNLGSISDVEKALELGATTYLVKADYKLEEISARVKSVLKVR